MDPEQVWVNIVAGIAMNPQDLPTVPKNARQPLWFYAYIHRGFLFVQKSNTNEPSAKISTRRRINYDDFDVVYTYYHRWLSGEKNVRHEVSRLSRNTAYIFALISKFEHIPPPGGSC